MSGAPYPVAKHQLGARFILTPPPPSWWMRLAAWLMEPLT